MSDYYTVLGVDGDASQSEIREAFHQLARQYHPDRNDTPAAAAKFLEVKEAYEVLGQPERRAIYDRYRRPRQKSSPESVSPPPRNESASTSKEMFLKVRRMTEEMQRRARAGRWGEATDIAEQIVSVRHEPSAYAVMGDAARVRGDFREAAKHYAFALQFDQTNEDYQRMHYAMLQAVQRQKGHLARDPGERNPGAFLVGVVVLMTAASYSALSQETAAFALIPPISTWGAGHFVMLIIGGLALGASLSASDLLDHFDLGGGAAGYRVHPGVAVSLVSLLNFWLAVGFYGLVGISQKSFNASVSRLIGFSAFATMIFAAFRWSHGGEAAIQTLLFGGTPVFLSGLFGWFIADAVRKVTP